MNAVQSKLGLGPGRAISLQLGRYMIVAADLRPRHMNLGTWKEKNKEFQTCLAFDPYLKTEVEDKIDQCCTYGFIEWSRNVPGLVCCTKFFVCHSEPFLLLHSNQPNWLDVDAVNAVCALLQVDVAPPR